VAVPVNWHDLSEANVRREADKERKIYGKTEPKSSIFPELFGNALMAGKGLARRGDRALSARDNQGLVCVGSLF
jgi:hypothetical protein